MTCTHAHEDLVDAVRGGDTSRLCPACIDRATAQRHLQAALAQIRLQDADLAPSTALEARLLAAVQTPSAYAALAGAGVSRDAVTDAIALRRPVVPAWWVPLAASCVLVVAGALALTTSRSQAPLDTDTSASSAQVTPATADATASEFVWLAGHEFDDPVDTAAVVRVRVAAADLSALGIVSLLARDPEALVDADVIVGTDGLARAVRVIDDAAIEHEGEGVVL